MGNGLSGVYDWGTMAEAGRSPLDVRVFSDAGSTAFRPDRFIPRAPGTLPLEPDRSLLAPREPAGLSPESVRRLDAVRAEVLDPAKFRSGGFRVSGGADARGIPLRSPGFGARYRPASGGAVAGLAGTALGVGTIALATRDGMEKLAAEIYGPKAGEAFRYATLGHDVYSQEHPQAPDVVDTPYARIMAGRPLTSPTWYNPEELAALRARTFVPPEKGKSRAELLKSAQVVPESFRVVGSEPETMEGALRGYPAQASPSSGLGQSRSPTDLTYSKYPVVGDAVDYAAPGSGFEQLGYDPFRSPPHFAQAAADDRSGFLGRTSPGIVFRRALGILDPQARVSAATNARDGSGDYGYRTSQFGSGILPSPDPIPGGDDPSVAQSLREGWAGLGNYFENLGSGLDLGLDDVKRGLFGVRALERGRQGNEAVKAAVTLPAEAGGPEPLGYDPYGPSTSAPAQASPATPPQKPSAVVESLYAARNQDERNAFMAAHAEDIRKMFPGVKSMDQLRTSADPNARALWWAARGIGGAKGAGLIPEKAMFDSRPIRAKLVRDTAARAEAQGRLNAIVEEQKRRDAAAMTDGAAADVGGPAKVGLLGRIAERVRYGGLGSRALATMRADERRAAYEQDAAESGRLVASHARDRDRAVGAVKQWALNPANGILSADQRAQYESMLPPDATPLGVDTVSPTTGARYRQVTGPMDAGLYPSESGGGVYGGQVYGSEGGNAAAYFGGRGLGRPKPGDSLKVPKNITPAQASVINSREALASAERTHGLDLQDKAADRTQRGLLTKDEIAARRQGDELGAKAKTYEADRGLEAANANRQAADSRYLATVRAAELRSMTAAKRKQYSDYVTATRGKQATAFAALSKEFHRDEGDTGLPASLFHDYAVTAPPSEYLKVLQQIGYAQGLPMGPKRSQAIKELEQKLLSVRQ